MNDEGIEITPEMGKAGIISQKKFVEEIEAKVKKQKADQEMHSTDQAREKEFQANQRREYEERDQGQDGIIAASVIPTPV